jgi:hypothetical protein
MRRVPDLTEYLEHFRKRVLQDAFAEATSSYWLRRSRAFAAVGTPACDEIAQACRNAAKMALLQDERGPEDVICPTCDTPTSPWSCSCGETRIDGAA